MSMTAVSERIALAAAATWRARHRHLDGHLVEERDGVVVSISGLPAPPSSAAAIEREPEDAEAALRWAEEVFASRGVPLGVTLERGRHASVDRAIASMGLHLHDSEPAMAIEAARVAQPPDFEGLEIRRATTIEDIDAMATLEVDVFGTDPETAAGYFSPGVLERPGGAFFLARLDGVPVSMASTHEHDGALGVFGVATATSARGRGYGSAVTATAILEGARAGADLAWLTASEKGRPVYERLGFEVVSTWDVWTRR